MARHGAPVVCDQDALLLSGEFKEVRILGSAQTGTLDIEDVDSRFTKAQSFDDSGVEVLIRQEADAHARFEPVCRRAVSSRAKRSGFVWLSGTRDRSSSRSPSAM